MCRSRAAESDCGALHVAFPDHDESVCDLRSANLRVILDRVGRWDDRAMIPKPLQIGERRQKKLPAETVSAKRFRNADRPERAQPAVVRFVRREARDLTFVFEREDVRSAQGLESPDGAEGALDEIENAVPIV